MNKALILLSTFLCLALLQVGGVVPRSVNSVLSIHAITASQCHMGKMQTGSNRCQSSTTWQQFAGSQLSISSHHLGLTISIFFLVLLWAIKSAPITRHFRPPNFQ